MLFSFLTFNFYDSPREADGGAKRDIKQEWQMAQTTDSAATSPMSGGGTPKQYSMHTPPPMKTLEECPEVRPSCPADLGAKRRRSIRRAGQNGRRSSVFFKLPDLASDTTVRVVGRSGGNDECSAPQSSAGTARNVNSNKTTTAAADQQRPQQQHHGLLASKLSRSSSRRRRASIAPGGGSPLRSRTAITSERKDISVVVKSVPEENPIMFGAAAAAVAAAAAAADGESSLSPRPTEEGVLSSHEDGAWRNAPRGELLLSWGDTGPTLAPAAHPSPRDSPARSSPRALSAGHRRESCRDGGKISRVPKGLTAERLLEDAQDVARIRSVARLRATYQGVCWMASNWCVGDKKGLLSGKRYLVLCDNTVWAELRKADADTSGAAVVGGAWDATAGPVGDHYVPGNSQGGFLPILSMVGSTVQHCEVATSNNGWVIEVVNTAANVTLWLDPENPASLLRWGSVLCQALATAVEEGDSAQNGEVNVSPVEGVE